jgi:iron complex outermembrane receptor protein
MGYNHGDNGQFQTGVANSLFVAPPNSLVFNNGTWAVAPSWNASTAAQQLAAYFDFARKVLENPTLAVASQNGTPGPAVHVRRPRWQTAGTKTTNFQADLAGNLNFSWGTFKPLAGVLVARNENSDYLIQSNGTLAAPNFRTWDVNPSSPTYFINRSTSSSLTTTPILNTNTLQRGTDEAAYAVLNGSFLQDQLQAVFGLRHNRSTTEVTDYRVSATPGIKSRFSRTIPQFGAGYKLTKGVLLYASYSESYALPTQPVLRGIATDSKGLPQQVFTGQAVPVRGAGYDLGLKTELYEGKFTSTFSVYEITQRDMVLTVGQQILGNSFSTDSQDNRVRGRGVEMEFVLTPTRNWQIFGSIAEEDIRNQKMPAGMAYYLGAHPLQSVKTLGNLWNRYTFNAGSLKGVWAGAGFNYVGPKALDTRNVELFAPAYTVWNASFGYDWKWQKTKFKAQLSLQNITDTDYQPTAATVGMPRRAVFSLTTEF